MFLSCEQYSFAHSLNRL